MLIYIYIYIVGEEIMNTALLGYQLTFSGTLH